MSLSPATIASQIFDQISSLNTSLPSFKFAVARLKRDLSKLEGVSRSKSYCLRGMIACLERDIPEMTKCHEAAIHTADAAELLHEAHINYSVSLGRTGHFFQSYEQAQSAYSLAQTHVRTLVNSYMICCLIGRFHEAASYIKGVDMAVLDDKMKNSVTSFRIFYDNYCHSGLQDTQVVEVMRLIYDRLNDQGFLAWNLDDCWTFHDADEEGPAHVLYTFDMREFENADELEAVLQSACEKVEGYESIKELLRLQLLRSSNNQDEIHPWCDILSVDKEDNYLAQYKITSLINDCFHSDKFGLVDESLSSLDIDKASPGLLVSILSSTLPARQHLESRPQFFARVEKSLNQRGKLKPGLLEGLQ